MDRKRVEAIKRSFAEKFSGELTEISGNTSDDWSPEAVVAARELLAERKGSGQLTEIDEQLAAVRAEAEAIESQYEPVRDPYSTWVSIIAWLYVFSGALGLLTQGIVASIFIAKFGSLFFQGLVDVAPFPIAYFAVLQLILATFCVLLILVGRGLLARKNWARIGALACCVPLVVMFPIGTVLSVVSLVLLIDHEKYNATALPAEET